MDMACGSEKPDQRCRNSFRQPKKMIDGFDFDGSNHLEFER